MKSKKNKILAATACGVIVTSIGASFLFNKPNEDKAEDIKKDIEEIENNETEELAEEIENTELTKSINWTSVKKIRKLYRK